MSSYRELRDKNRKSLQIALGITAFFFFVELIGGWLTNSLALLSDAGHMLTDVLALGLSLFAMWLAKRPPTKSHTFGYHRFEIFAAFLNGLTLAGISVYIFVEAYQRIQNPPEVAGFPMMLIATVGLLVNLLSGFFLHKSKDDSLNVKGAYLHVLGDALGSVGAIVAGIIMWTTGWMYADPIFSVVIGMIIIASSWRLMRDTFHVLMQGTPPEIEPEDVQTSICNLKNVTGVHDLHIWTLTNGIHAMTVHVNVDESVSQTSHDDIIHAIREMTMDEYGIQHTTVQLEMQENGDHRCIVQEEH
ncbi:MAG: cation diffusion facilitator family transporter [Candidatus Marinimicrobia bacterium]|nr:cation diffusion facilitator family transporter [Candidatus Neomarinimicrobiota bacterium]MCF7830235.1 cation diffusion facilitator family transporter [Candidatus Neomarinimicrobiota bacterium]MCF7882262.1 cation diffusion facilitator family transporter [Candidatus Neomarinimicrobiota bacterium]